MKVALVIMFVVAGSVAHASPRAPTVTSFHVTIEKESGLRARVHELWFESEVSPETALLEIMIEDQLGSQTISTTPDKTHLYLPDLRLMAGQLKIDIVAIDEAGRRSEPNVWHFVRTTEYVRFRCGLGLMAPLILFVPILIVGLLIGVVIVAAIRSSKANQPGDAVSPLVADYIAHAVRRRASSGSVATIVGIVAALALDHTLLAALLGFLICVPLSALQASRLVLRELGRERARAELRGTLLIVRSPNGQARVSASRRLIKQARRRGVPTSTAL
jgi:hypothetical protein